jgi:hypothetical protein
MPSRVKVIYLPMNDRQWNWRSSPKEVRALVKIAKSAAAMFQRGNRVLVTCSMGWNRSGLVTGLILRALGFPGGKAVDLIKQRRGPGALSNWSFAGLVRDIGKQKRREEVEQKAPVIESYSEAIPENALGGNGRLPGRAGGATGEHGLSHRERDRIERERNRSGTRKDLSIEDSSTEGADDDASEWDIDDDSGEEGGLDAEGLSTEELERELEGLGL